MYFLGKDIWNCVTPISMSMRLRYKDTELDFETTVTRIPHFMTLRRPQASCTVRYPGLWYAHFIFTSSSVNCSLPEHRIQIDQLYADVCCPLKQSSIDSTVSACPCQGRGQLGRLRYSYQGAMSV